MPSLTPTYVTEVDFGKSVNWLAFTSPARYRAVWILARYHGEPLGVLTMPARPAELASPSLTTRFGELVGLPPGVTFTEAGIHTQLEHLRDSRDDRQKAALASESLLSVCICTRGRVGPLRRTLDSLAGQRYPHFRVVVVENNATVDPSVRALTIEYESQYQIKYFHEPQLGLSHARNRALKVADGEVLAWLDDDAIADPDWLLEIVAAFVANPDAACVSGVVLPAELETRAQMHFEEFNGHRSGRGFVPARLASEPAGLINALFPRPAFGAGANMSFRSNELRQLGGFDTALGAGALVGAGEDTLIFTRLLRGGKVIVYEPRAIVFHYHRRDDQELRDQLKRYASGLSAVYTALLIEDPRSMLQALPGIARLAWRSKKRTAVQTDVLALPRNVRIGRLAGLILGPPRYLWSRYTSKLRLNSV